MYANHMPSLEQITEMMPRERKPYILGGVALASGDLSQMTDALSELHIAHTEGVLRPPLPSVLHDRVEQTSLFVTKRLAGGLEDQVDKGAVSALLALALDFGNVRYPTDVSQRERRQSERTNGSRTARVRPNPPIIPEPTRSSERL